MKAYEAQEEKNRKNRILKEALSLKVSIKSADDTANVLNDKDIELPKNMDDLKDLFKIIIDEHEKKKQPKGILKNATQKALVKDRRGATVQKGKGKRKGKATSQKSTTSNANSTSLNSTKSTTPTQTKSTNSNRQSQKRRRNGKQAVDAELDSGKGKRSKKSTRK